MQKQYKCVKKYPRGPEVGSIVIEFNLEHPRYYKLVSSQYDFTAHYLDIENYPEFWEEVKEIKLDVPIGTKFTFIDNFNIIYQIIKVENDKVVFHNEHFVKGHNFLCPVKSANEHFKNGNWIICKEHIFKDFLGNDLVEGKTVWVVENLDTPWSTTFIYPKNNSYWNLFRDKNETTLIFSSKEDAYQYILDNKPVYSRKEVLEALDRELNYLGVVSAKENIKKILGL